MSRLGAVFGRRFKGNNAARAQGPALSGEPEGPEHVGQILRECREHYGEDVEGVALALRIRVVVRGVREATDDEVEAGTVGSPALSVAQGSRGGPPLH